MSTVAAKSTYRDLASANPNMTETEILNSANPSASLPTESDATVIGGGIHGLMYSIHTRMVNPEADLKITVLEKAAKPQWKIGESTLPLWGQWAKSLGLKGEYLLRIFGLKHGLEFYILDRENPGQYKEFCNNGPPMFFLPGFQVERSISELLLTLFAQRNGVNVWHGHQADVKNTILSLDGDVIPIKNTTTKQEVVNNSKLVVDGTGRFRQYSSKASRVKRFDGWNTDAFWGYFDCLDEEGIADHLKHFEGCHTNHMCFPEGWAWMIRLLTWEGTPLANLMDMLNYLLDHAAAGTPGDEVPSTNELAQMFDCKPTWVYSIGFAVRNDVEYPDITHLGKSEGERRFNYWTKKYSKINSVMTHFRLLEDYYGPGTTWHIRKTLTYQTQIVSGPGWITVGDGIGFTNPLHSPGITAGMGSDVLAAHLTVDGLKAKTEEERAAAWAKYDEFCREAVPSLHYMNKFNYLCFRVPILAARVSLMWQFVSAIALPGFTLGSRAYEVPIKEYAPYNTNWVWGSQVEEYVKVSRYAIEKLDSIPLDQRPSDEVVNDIIAFSEAIKTKAVADNRFPFRWNGVFRSYDRNLNYDEVAHELQDIFSNQCSNCKTWTALRGDWKKCYTCGVTRPESEIHITWRPPLVEKELQVLTKFAPSVEAVGPQAIQWVAAQKAKADEEANRTEAPAAA